MAECIHGLDIPLCDICYPKAAPVVAKSAQARTAAPRAASSSPRASQARTSRTSINPATQRVYHVTHINNLASIVESGALRADATPVVDLSTELTRELRITAEVSPGESVAEFVPFFADPEAVEWVELRGGAADTSRWSAAARASHPADFVFLISTVGALGQSVVVADGDAAATFTRFATGEPVLRMLERLHDNESSRLSAEVLARDAVPLSAIQLVGVANDRVRDRVRELIAEWTPAPKIAVYPPWFQV